MVRLFKVVDDKYEEVKSTERLSNIVDAANIASKTTGDGGYVADFGNGSCVIFDIADGELDLDKFNAKIWVEPDLRPSVMYDQEHAEEQEDPQFKIVTVRDDSENEIEGKNAVDDDF